VGITPSQSVEGAIRAGISMAPWVALLQELWEAGDAAAYGLARSEFDRILLHAGTAQNHGLPAGAAPTAQQQAAWFRGIRVNDLVLARACGEGHERAWEHFLALYHQPLVRAAIAITGSDTLGRDLADALYAELYGLTTRDGQRRCPLDSYKGRGSLIGWLRTTLAQRHVDHHRRSHRELPLDDPEVSYEPAAPEPAAVKLPAELSALGKAVQAVLLARQAEDRFLLASYYLDGRTLLQIARVLNVHEATVSRKLRRVVEELRKQVLRHLQAAGLSRRAAQEALGADPRDLDLNLKKLLQSSVPDPFKEKADR
jgi:RNA polymerase sigma-70 factor (ECF subfamily)